MIESLTNQIFHGNCMDVLKDFPDESIDMCITSPPYWSKRDYGTAKWEGGDGNCDHKVGRFEYKVSGKQKSNFGSAGHQARGACPKCGAKRVDCQIGLEPSFNDYIDNLIKVFSEVKRIIKPTGSCWVNLGDTFYGGGRNKGSEPEQLSDKQKSNKGTSQADEAMNFEWSGELPEKCLCMIPARFAIAMCDNGWTLRNEIIWRKMNVFPESVTDRFTASTERIYFFVKNKEYYFEQQFDRALSNVSSGKNWEHRKMLGAPMRHGLDGAGKCKDGGFQHNEKGKNKRDVWEVNVQPISGLNHYATYPIELISPAILSGCPKDGLVLDPFMGSGTTAIAAKQLNRNYVGIELNEKYISTCDRRLKKTSRNMF